MIHMVATAQLPWVSFALSPAENAGVWVGILSGGLTALVVVSTAGAWLYRRFVNAVAKAVREMNRRLDSNGGDTTNAGDRLLRIERRERAIMRHFTIPDDEPDEHELRSGA